jgi:hypothetical protein
MVSIRQRVEALRQEIAELQKLNLEYLQMRRQDFPPAMAAHARRKQRLEEIVDELKAMTVWKKL